MSINANCKRGGDAFQFVVHDESERNVKGPYIRKQKISNVKEQDLSILPTSSGPTNVVHKDGYP